MAKEINQRLLDKLVGIVKKEPNASESYYVEKSGIERGQILRYLVQAEVIANPKLKIPATSKAVVQARDVQGLRWPRIAARAGISVSAAHDLYEQSGKTVSDSYTGRGRKYGEAGGGAGPGGGSARKSASGRRSGAKSKAATATATSGRRGASKRGAAKKTAAAPAARGRRGTRASAKSADPS